jgi:hypothetical protein
MPTPHDPHDGPRRGSWLDNEADEPTLVGYERAEDIKTAPVWMSIPLRAGGRHAGIRAWLRRLLLVRGRKRRP